MAQVGYTRELPNDKLREGIRLGTPEAYRGAKSFSFTIWVDPFAKIFGTISMQQMSHLL